MLGLLSLTESLNIVMSQVTFTNVLVPDVLHFIQDQVKGVAVSAETSLYLDTSSSFAREAETFSGQLGHIVPSVYPGSAPGPPPSGMCLEHLPREVSRGYKKKDFYATSAYSLLSILLM